MTGLILRHFYAIIYALNDQVYVPRIVKRDHVSWCKGCFIGITVERPDWMPLMSSQADLFATILQYGTTDDDQVSINADHEAAVVSLTSVVSQIHAACLNQRRDQLADQTSLGKLHNWGRARAPNKVRRNDPCPCGSKKEFKLCHGLVKR